MQPGEMSGYAVRAVSHYQKVDTDTPILDFGCGRGEWALDMQAAGYAKTHGFDISRERVNHARVQSSALGVTDNTFFSDASEIPDDYYRACISNTVIEHVADLDKSACMLAQKMHPESIFLAWYPARFGIVEEHVFVPFAHWIPSGPFRSAYCDFFHRYGRSPLPGAESDEYLRDKTSYRRAGQVRRIFAKYFEEVRFVGLDMLSRHSGAQAPALRSVGRIASRLDPFLKTEWAFANLVTARLLCRRPIKNRAR